MYNNQHGQYMYHCYHMASQHSHQYLKKTKVTLKSQMSLMKINVKVSIFPFNFTACKPRAEESANESSDSEFLSYCSVEC